MVTFDRDDILGALDELVGMLVAAPGGPHIRIVGGAAIAVRFTRDATTTDVDALYGSAPEVEAAARRVARRRGWPDDWLNDKVKLFASHFDGPEDWLSFDVRDGIEVRIAGAPLLLAMKLRAARGRHDAARHRPPARRLFDHHRQHSGRAVRALYPDELLPPRARAQLRRASPSAREANRPNPARVSAILCQLLARRRRLPGRSRRGDGGEGGRRRAGPGVRTGSS